MKNDGGPAFPLPLRNDETYNGEGSENGMSLRDYFAAQALPACIRTCGTDSREPGVTLPQHFATQAYACADAMLKARKP